MKSLKTRLLFLLTLVLVIPAVPAFAQSDFRDCDGDGIDDRNQLVDTFVSPAGGVDDDSGLFDNVEGNIEVDGASQTFLVPPSVGDVSVVLDATGGTSEWVGTGPDDADENLLVYVNGTPVGRAYDGVNANVVTVPLATWNSLVDGSGEVVITLELSAGAPVPSGFLPVGTVYLTYLYDRDLNDNGWLDDCIPDGDPSGPDTDGDGVSDNIDRSPNTIADPTLVDAHGELLRVARFDVDEDGDVDVEDFDLLDAAARDIDGDGGFDLHDLAPILHGSRGPGVAADPAFLQELRLFKAFRLGDSDFPAAWYSPLGGLNVRSYDHANAFCQAFYGTHLASIDKYQTTTSLTQNQQIRQLHREALASAGGEGLTWIGLKWDTSITLFRWENGQKFNPDAIPPEPQSVSAYGNGGEIPGSSFFVPGQDDWCVFAVDEHNGGTPEAYRWLTGDCEAASLGEEIITGFVAQLPENTVAPAPVTTTETVTLTLDSSLDGLGVIPGQTVDWTISFQVSSGDNSGLALLVTDLAQDGGNPVAFDLPAGDAAPTALQNFAAPLGFNSANGFGGLPAGTPGAMNLTQIGGAQNTFGGASSDSTQGQGATVVTGIGQSGSTILATGSFTAPATLGTYTFRLNNTLASVLKTVGGVGEGSEIVPANLTFAQDSFTIEVNTPPVITLLGDNPATHEATTPYVDAGATASDAEDGNLTTSIVVSNGVDAGALGSYAVTYNVADSQGLAAAEVTRTVNVVDTTPPVITLLGDNPVNLVAGETYIEPGATALDSLEGDLSSSVTVSGTVNILVHGTNVLTYHVTDGSGNAATPVTRTVFVDGDEPPVFDEATVSVAIDEASTGVVHRAAAGDPDGGVRFDHPGYVALFPTDEGVGAGVVDSLGSGLGLSFIKERWATDAAAPGGENVLNTEPQVIGGVADWFTVDDFNVTDGLTVSEWFRFDNLQSSIYDPVIWKFGDLRLVDYNGTLGLIGAGQTRVASPFVDAEWAHLIFSIGADGNYTVYLNGAELYSGQTTFDSSLTENFFGHDWATVLDGVDGARSDLSIIDGALSATQAQMLYQSAHNGHRGDVLRYSLGTDGGDEGFFTIDAYTGEISLGTALSYETPGDADGDNVYQVEVIATDDEGLSGSQTVAFTLSNSNLGPVITGTLLDPIEEVNGYYVYDFTVTDGDTAPGDLSIQVTDNRFTVSPDGAGGYRVHRQSFHRFDYEAVQDYDFDLVVSDGVEEARADIAFTLVNLNDNTPVVSFTGAGPVAENDPGAVLGVFTITDADGDETFYFNIDPRFELAADNRTLKLKDGVALDYETEPSLAVNVLIADRPIGGGDFNPAFYNGTIAVSNVNDVAPHDLQLAGQSVAENAPGAVIGTLSAVDEDGPGLTFGVSDARFAVQGTSLKLADGVSLDREATPTITLGVAVSDGDFMATRTFTITVLNVDEGAPENIALTNATIEENTTGVLGELSATDVDGDAITFSVTDRRFAVTGTTLELTRPLNFEGHVDGTLSLAITATGGGASTTETLQITVEDVNEAPDMSLTAGPSSGLIDLSYAVPVMENVRQATYTEPGDPGATQWPLSFVASDVDGDALSWVLAGADAAAFTVDPATGALLFVNTPDYEAPGDADTNGVYEVSVSASDGELSSRTITLVLTLVDVAEDPYDNWATERGLTPGVNDGRDDDPDEDGCPNWKEFALDGNPLSGSNDGKLRCVPLETGGIEHLALTIPVRSGAVFSGSPGLAAAVDGITYTIQGTGDLMDWSQSVSEVVPADSDGLPALNSGWEYRTFILDDTTLQQGFLRAGLQWAP